MNKKKIRENHYKVNKSTHTSPTSTHTYNETLNTNSLKFKFALGIEHQGLFRNKPRRTFGLLWDKPKYFPELSTEDKLGFFILDRII